MFQNFKLLTTVVVLAILGFVLVLGVLFDSYRQSMLNQKLHEQEINLRNLKQLVSTGGTAKKYSIELIIESLQKIRNSADIFIIRNRDGEFTYIDDDNLLADQKLKDYIFAIPMSHKRKDYRVENDFYITWVGLTDEAKQSQYFDIQITENHFIREFWRDFGVPIFVTFLVVSWLLVWAGLIVRSLFVKLNDQNFLLENQSRKLKDAHDIALNSNKAKTVFLANMSHEIRTPLTAIIGFSKSLLESDQTMQERIGAIKTIHHSGKHLLHIVDEILDLSKIETQSLDVEIMDVSPAMLLNEICPLLRMQAETKGLEFRVNYRFPIPSIIRTDPTRLKQILLNLVSNAIKFTENGYVHINVSCSIETGSLYFDVTDTGIGMNKHQQERVFTAFTQADSSTTRKYGGTGLGLTLSRELAIKLGGSLSVDSQPGAGSSMKLKVSAGSLKHTSYLKSTADLPDESESNDTSLRKVNLTGSVLLAEDNPANQKLFEFYLKAVGVTTTTVENGAQAVDKALIKNYDLIFMDMQMPVMNGLDAVKELRKNNYQSPIIALTANSTVEDRDACFAAGYDEFISKPVDRNKFIEVLCHYLPESEPDEQEMTVILSTALEDEPELVDLVLDFLGKLPGTLERIRTAFDNDIMPDLKSEIHKLKGVGASYGYSELTQMAGKIEFQIQNNNRSEIEALISDLAVYVQRIVKGRPEIETRYGKDIAQG